MAILNLRNLGFGGKAAIALSATAVSEFAKNRVHLLYARAVPDELMPVS